MIIVIILLLIIIICILYPPLLIGVIVLAFWALCLAVVLGVLFFLASEGILGPLIIMLAIIAGGYLFFIDESPVKDKKEPIKLKERKTNQ